MCTERLPGVVVCTQRLACRSERFQVLNRTKSVCPVRSANMHKRKERGKSTTETKVDVDEKNGPCSEVMKTNDDEGGQCFIYLFNSSKTSNLCGIIGVENGIPKIGFPLH